jgi:RNA polymerase sigma factor (sigma-70 family)
MSICPACRAAILACARREEGPCAGARQLLGVWVLSLAPLAASRFRGTLDHDDAVELAALKGYRILVSDERFDPAQTILDQQDVNAFLWTCMRNELADERRKIARSPFGARVDPEEAPVPGSDQARVDLALCLVRERDRWLAAASDAERVIVKLKWQEFTGGPRRTESEIADIVGVHQSTVSRTWTKFMAHLKQCLS